MGQRPTRLVVELHGEVVADLRERKRQGPVEQHGRAKYQEHDGPGFVDAVALPLERATDPDAELRNLAGAMVFTVLNGNSDAHAKNLSLLLDPPGTLRLAPLYDTVPTMLFSKLKVRCALSVGGVHRSLPVLADMPTFHTRDLSQRLEVTWRAAQDAVEAAAGDLARDRDLQRHRDVVGGGEHQVLSDPVQRRDHCRVDHAAGFDTVVVSWVVEQDVDRDRPRAGVLGPDELGQLPQLHRCGHHRTCSMLMGNGDSGSSSSRTWLSMNS